MSAALIDSDQSLKATIGNFHEVHPEGEVLHGAYFYFAGNSVLRIPGGDILSIYSKSIRATFDDVRLKALALDITVDEHGYSQLYELLGYQATCVSGTSLGSHKRFTAQLVISDTNLLKIAKQTPPSGDAEDRLLGLVQMESHLLQRLDAWDLRTIKPHLD